MADSDRISRLEEAVGHLTTACAANDARSDERWQQQRQHNGYLQAKLDGLSHRLLAVEKRVIWLSALAAAGGGAVGSMLPF